MKKQRLENEFGFIDYSYETPNTHPEGLLVFMGSYVNKEHRNRGKFKFLVKELFCMFPYGTTVQLATTSAHLSRMFSRLGFEEVEEVEHWKNTSNTIKMQGSISTKMINSIL